jgi:hypothetical protein
MPIVPRAPRNPIKSDPTPKQGVRMPTHAERRDLDESEQAASTQHLPLMEPEVAQRRARMQPLLLLLALVAVAAVVWTAVQLARR